MMWVHVARDLINARHAKARANNLASSNAVGAAKCM